GLKERYEVHHGVRIQDSAIVAAATLSNRYISDRFLPDKAIDLIDESASRLRMEIDSMPAEMDEVRRKLMQLQIEEQALKKETDSLSKGRLDEISREIARLNEESSGLQDPNRPIGSFLFAGPTGVGKTELARALAEFLFDDEQAMVRLDMSEYMEKHSVARLIGAPPGYVGYDEGGQLTEAVRRRPYTVVLFDEIEKAHRDVFNVLLQILDDGRLTDGQGRTVDFRNAVIILTSNLGSQHVTGGDTQTEELRVREAIRAELRPELLNRIDEIVVFHSLGREELARIVEIQLGRLSKLLSDKQLKLELTDRAKQAVGKAGYDPVYGARPLKRALQRLVLDPLAMRVLKGDFKPGDTVRVDASTSDDVLSFSRANG